MLNLLINRNSSKDSIIVELLWWWKPSSHKIFISATTTLSVFISLSIIFLYKIERKTKTFFGLIVKAFKRFLWKLSFLLNWFSYLTECRCSLSIRKDSFILYDHLLLIRLKPVLYVYKCILFIWMTAIVSTVFDSICFNHRLEIRIFIVICLICKDTQILYKYSTTNLIGYWNNSLKFSKRNFSNFWKLHDDGIQRIHNILTKKYKMFTSHIFP